MRTRTSSLALFTLLIAACGPSTPGETPDASENPGIDAQDNSCVEGVQRCSGNTLERCTQGEYQVTEECANACSAEFGCVFCSPGTGTCNGDVGQTCLPDGSAYEENVCDPVQGMSCNQGTGQCDGACSLGALGTSYIGCEYYPTVTAQIVSTDFLFAVAIANTTGSVANITIDEGALGGPMTFTVNPNSVAVQELPWVPQLKLCNTGGSFGCTDTPNFASAVVPGGAYHLRSDQPITVYQFSPLDYTNGSFFTYTNDASLLLPVNALTGNYIAAAWPFWADYSYPGMMAVTATSDDTMVTITARANANGNPNFPAGTPTTVALNRGDVVQLLNMSGDLTGSIVEADKPVQLISGHYCSDVPFGIRACDHLEESMFPVETLSTDYLVTAAAVPTIPNGKEQVVRIIATEANTVLTYDPPVAGAGTTLANIGDQIEISRYAGSFLVSADKKILVAHLMEGQNAGGNTGDPAMTLAVPVDQYRTQYLFHAPTNYEVNYVNITAPVGATVMLDGAAVGGFEAIGGTGYSVARIQLDAGPAGDGNHSIDSTEAFGITVYGYGQYTSYYYPGGLNLSEIVID